MYVCMPAFSGGWGWGRTPNTTADMPPCVKTFQQKTKQKTTFVIVTSVSKTKNVGGGGGGGGLLWMVFIVAPECYRNCT